VAAGDGLILEEDEVIAARPETEQAKTHSILRETMRKLKRSSCRGRQSQVPGRLASLHG